MNSVQQPIFSDDEKNRLYFEAGQVFNPHSPISERDLFSGRKTQIMKVLDIISQKGLHAIIYGERGVGKSSLANVLEKFFPIGRSFSSTRINCDGSDSFLSVWRKVFDQMNLASSSRAVGFHGGEKRVSYGSADLIPSEENVPDQVRRALTVLSESFVPVIIIDEFDRLEDGVKRLFSDFIKAISDHAINSTIILVGVGDNVSDLIKEHESLSRNLVQIPMPRMNATEIEEILTGCLKKLNMTITGDALIKIRVLCKGLPHYAHLIGLNAARNAIQESSTHVTEVHYLNSLRKSVEDSNQSILTSYENAIRSQQKENLFAEVLFACAKVDVNDLGEFSAKDIKKPLHEITGRGLEIPSYSKHLNEFTDTKRGNILIKSGTPRKYRFKFKDPLMQPFILMKEELTKSVGKKKDSKD